MNQTSDSAAAGQSGSFSPEQAASLLEQTTQRARRQFQASPPWLLATRAVLVLLALGAIWLSVRGQHPYRGPTAGDIPILIAFVALNFVATVGVRRHAIAGVSGRTPFGPVEIIALALSFVAAVLLMLGLGAGGVGFAYYPTSVLVVPGLAWAVISALRGNRPGLATGVALVVLGLVGAFAGSAGSWAVAAVGLCLILLGNAVAAWRQLG
jgi:hypothetical protein